MFVRIKEISFKKLFMIIVELAILDQGFPKCGICAPWGYVKKALGGVKQICAKINLWKSATKGPSKKFFHIIDWPTYNNTLGLNVKNDMVVSLKLTVKIKKWFRWKQIKLSLSKTCYI